MNQVHLHNSTEIEIWSKDLKMLASNGYCRTISEISIILIMWPRNISLSLHHAELQSVCLLTIASNEIWKRYKMLNLCDANKNINQKKNDDSGREYNCCKWEFMVVRTDLQRLSLHRLDNIIFRHTCNCARIKSNGMMAHTECTFCSFFCWTRIINILLNDNSNTCHRHLYDVYIIFLFHPTFRWNWKQTSH